MPEFAAPDFEAAYQGSPPWDIGAPQPEVARLEGEGAFRGSVLDVGCGTGENALFLAARGHSVLGVDTAPTAVARARKKAEERAVPGRFAVADALALAALRERFETVLDCGLFHVFDDTQRPRYAESLASAVASGGQLHLLCFSDEEPPGRGPRRISEWDLRSTFRGLFVLSQLRAGRFTTRVDGAAGEPWRPHAWVATLTRL